MSGDYAGVSCPWCGTRIKYSKWWYGYHHNPPYYNGCPFAEQNFNDDEFEKKILPYLRRKEIYNTSIEEPIKLRPSAAELAQMEAFPNDPYSKYLRYKYHNRL